MRHQQATDLLWKGNNVIKNFPKTVYLSIGGGGDDSYLSASNTEQDAIKATDDGAQAQVAEYRLVSVRKRRLHTAVIDAK